MTSHETTVVIPLYDRFTALDVIGPYQMLALTPGIRVVLAAERAGPVLDDCRTLRLTAVGLDEAPRPDVVVVPGGPGTVHVLEGALPAWLRDVHPSTRWTTSVCSGSLVLGAAGLIDGLRATTHYRHLDKLPLFGAVPARERVVVEREARIVTAAGVSSGIDMALRLVEFLTDTRTAQAVQLWTEYDPAPPFDAGSPSRAPEDVVELAAGFEAAALEAAMRP
ncbi:transcriptional regulator GlxA family with amidase domain [Actinomadura coerulea]|uniref:Transcriptional regulator GlxA family with amidase domain n=1 Tax=Actinomadura coerulea TaxID=46159 RepID=A0A7X0FZP7_9ACTN|nr:DJ-1/PfpI family protein [Actinomadura coerulea]MBB6395816.1 transcriptional regulator GlxA family with amidase domain [Actinomadura coerulea]GGQ27318.1 glutamine amidotransferase [Actinomadura coerulea]